MLDFSLKIYKTLLNNLLSNNYKFIKFEDYLATNKPSGKLVILRHDVDKLPKNALKKARIEHNLNVRSTYNFRVVKSVYKEEIIDEISSLNHEIGYHYEEMDFSNGNKDKALAIFEENLEKFRKIYPVKTICMHGSPLSKYDNKDLWKKYNYRDYGIIGEPYFDIDWNEMFYLTDTGRTWNHDGVSVRDKVDGNHKYAEISKHIKSTQDIIKLANEGKLPNKIMINTHPQRWTNNPLLWTKELVMQNAKNVVKRVVVSRVGSK